MRYAIQAKIYAFSTLALACLIPHPSKAEDWSGAYIGARVSAAFGDMKHVHQNDPTNTSTFENLDFDISDIGGGVYGGYRMQSGDYVFGFELGYDYLNVEDELFIPATAGPYPPNPTWDRSRQMSVDHLFSASITAGRSFGSSLVYGKAGIGAADVRTFGANVSATPNIYGDVSEYEFAWMLGAGMEHRLKDGYSIGLEYNFIGIDGDTRVIPCVNAGCDVGFGDPKASIHKIDLRLSKAF